MSQCVSGGRVSQCVSGGRVSQCVSGGRSDQVGVWSRVGSSRSCVGVEERGAQKGVEKFGVS